MAEAALMMTPSILVVMTRVVQFVTAEVKKIRCDREYELDQRSHQADV